MIATNFAGESACSSRRASCPTSMRVGEALDLFASFYEEPADPDALIDRPRARR